MEECVAPTWRLMPSSVRRSPGIRGGWVTSRLGLGGWNAIELVEIQRLPRYPRIILQIGFAFLSENVHRVDAKGRGVRGGDRSPPPHRLDASGKHPAQRRSTRSAAGVVSTSADRPHGVVPAPTVQHTLWNSIPRSARHTRFWAGAAALHDYDWKEGEWEFPARDDPTTRFTMGTLEIRP